MNNNIESKVKKLAKPMNMSISKYITNILEQKTIDTCDNDIKSLSGTWSDFPSIEEIRKDSHVADAKREIL